jgi:small subunit ribosomal protein S1
MSKATKVHNQDSAMSKYFKDTDLVLKNFVPGEFVEGVVVSVRPGEVLIDVGSKSEGIVTGEELGSPTEYQQLKPGQSVLVTVVQSENEQGYVVLSLKKAEKEKKWKEFSDAYESQAVLEVIVLEYNKGGLLVDCMGVIGFVPLSHLDRVHFANDLAKYAAGSEAELKSSLKVLSGKTLKVKIIELDKVKNRLVFSEKDALPTYSDEAKKEKLAKVSEGDVLTGIVTGLMPFGIFVDLEGIEGLVHISEIAWEKVHNPGDYYSVGSPITVKVLGIADDTTGKLALSVKRLSENPWEKVEERYPVGSVVEGTVNKIVPFGAFVTLEKGLDALLHISESANSVKEGETIKAVVTMADGVGQKLALSTRKLQDQE